MFNVKPSKLNCWPLENTIDANAKNKEPTEKDLANCNSGVDLYRRYAKLYDVFYWILILVNIVMVC